MPKSVKEDVRAKIARAYIADLIKNGDLPQKKEQILVDAHNILLTATIPPQED